jgi:hypothetical protein
MLDIATWLPYISVAWGRVPGVYETAVRQSGRMANLSEIGVEKGDTRERSCICSPMSEGKWIQHERSLGQWITTSDIDPGSRPFDSRLWSGSKGKAFHESGTSRDERLGL